MSSPPQPPAPDPPPVYTYENITVLTGLEHIRRRPGMYIGDTGVAGLHYMLMEGVVNLTLDQMLAGRCREVSLEVLADGGCCFRYDCPEPLDQFQTLDRLVQLPCPSGRGIHGVGFQTAIALSLRLDLEQVHKGTRRRQQFGQGRAVGETETTPCDKGDHTTITFWPDSEIFRSNPAFEYERIAKRLRELSFLFPGVELRLIDHRSPLQQTFCSTGGLAEYVRDLNRSRQAIHPNIFHTESSAGMPKDVTVQLAMQWTGSDDESYISLVNTYPTSDGSHLTGLRTGIVQGIRKHGTIYGIREDEELMGEDFRAGLTAVLALYLPEPQFASANRTRLYNPEIEWPIANLVKQSLALFLEANSADADAIVSRVRKAGQDRVQAQEEKRRRNHPRRGSRRQR